MEKGQDYLFALLDGSPACNNGMTLIKSEDNGATWTSGLFNLPTTFFNLIEKNESGSCLFVYAPHIEKLYRMCDQSANIDENNPLTISIMPNPTTGIITVTEVTETTQVALYNTQGKLLKKYSQITNNDSINLSEFSAGLYFLKVQNASGSKTFKVLRE